MAILGYYSLLQLNLRRRHFTMASVSLFIIIRFNTGWPDWGHAIGYFLAADATHAAPQPAIAGITQNTTPGDWILSFRLPEVSFQNVRFHLLPESLFSSSDILRHGYWPVTLTLREGCHYFNVDISWLRTAAL